jgi:hypothetical protein
MPPHTSNPGAPAPPKKNQSGPTSTGARVTANSRLLRRDGQHRQTRQSETHPTKITILSIGVTGIATIGRDEFIPC